MSSRAWILLLAALAGLATAGCATKIRNYRCTPIAEATSAEYDSIWTCNRKIIVRAIKGKGFSLREFRYAVEFFETATGIPADVRQSEQGIVPGPRLDRSLEAWDDWMREVGSVARPGGGN